jgi:hypothetical protein
MAEERSESRLTVLVALGANLTIAVLKLFAGLVTGSAAMLSEAAHSVADTLTEALLFTGRDLPGTGATRRSRAARPGPGPPRPASLLKPTPAESATQACRVGRSSMSSRPFEHVESAVRACRVGRSSMSSRPLG